MERYRPEDLAWIAGIIDGEGSIGIFRMNNGSLHLRVQVSNTDGRIIEELQRVFPGKIYKLKRTPLTRHPALSWRLYSDDAAYMLQHIGPFLRAKTIQAATAIRYRKLVHQGANPDELEAMKQYMGELNSGKLLSAFYPVDQDILEPEKDA